MLNMLHDRLNMLDDLLNMGYLDNPLHRMHLRGARHMDDPLDRVGDVHMPDDLVCMDRAWYLNMRDMLLNVRYLDNPLNRVYLGGALHMDHPLID